MSIWKELETGVVTRSAAETRNLGARLALDLPADSTIALEGDLGVGKTTLVQGIAIGLGVERNVTSPTFTLFSVYPGRQLLVHLDAYRLESSEQVGELLIDDFLKSPYCLVVEWPSKIRDWLPPATRTLKLSIVEPGVHRIESAGLEAG